jgi:Homeodomain-like domain
VFRRSRPGSAARKTEIGCQENTVRRWLHRFNAAGIAGQGSQPGAGRKRRITGAERSRIITLARPVLPGRLTRDAAGELPADNERGGPAARRPAPIRNSPPKAPAPG